MDGRNSPVCAGNPVTQYSWNLTFEVGCTEVRGEGRCHILMFGGHFYYLEAIEEPVKVKTGERCDTYPVERRLWLHWTAWTGWGRARTGSRGHVRQSGSRLAERGPGDGAGRSAGIRTGSLGD